MTTIGSVALLLVLTQGLLAKELRELHIDEEQVSHFRMHDYIKTYFVAPFLHVCHRSDPNLGDCIRRSVEKIKPLMVTGSPEYNIPCIEPLIIKDLIKEESSGLTITTTDVIAYGGSNFVVNSVNLSIDSGRFKVVVEVELPELRIEARYNIQGKLVILQVKGNGLFYGNITNCTSRSVLKGEHYIRDGEEYIRFTSNTMKNNISGGKVLLQDIFKQKMLNDVVNEAINKNFHLFLKELMPIIEKSLANVFLNVSNAVVEQYTYDQLFPA